MTNRVGVLGGTFDPVHNGHLTIAHAFLNSGYIDELWIMPAPDPPHKKNQNVTPYEIRKELLTIAFHNIPNIHISDFENNLESPSYTLRTIRALKKRYPQKHFILCLGSDSLVQLDTWYHYEELINESEFLIAYRPGYDISDLPKLFQNKCSFVEHDPIDISSTELKNKIRKEESVVGLLPVNVLKRIRELDLYL
jgi:nicotinate-nucleotide adenylyltransferase